MIRLLQTFFLLAGPLLLSAQGPPPGVSTGGRPAERQEEEDRLPDSIKVQYLLIDDPNTYYRYLDTSLDNQLHNYDPARLRDVEYIHLGNQGSAAVNLQYTAQPFIGFDAGYHQYDLYNYDLSTFRFFESNVPIVNGSFTPMGSQDNFVVGADFTRTFTDGFTVASNYRRINQAGIYQEEATKITNFGVSIRYQHPNKRYTAFLSMISNVSEQANSGGLLDTAQLSTIPRGSRALATPALTGASTRHQQKLYNLTNYYILAGSQNGLQLKLRYDFGLDNRYYKYGDADLTENTTDTAYYGELSTDPRGIRHYTRVNKLHNAMYTYVTKGSSVNLRAGVIYDRYGVEQDVFSTAYDNVYLDFKGDVPFYKNLSLQTSAQLGIGDGAGDFNVDGAIDLSIPQIGSLTTGLSLYRHSPTLLQQSLILTQDTIWDKDLDKPIGTDFYAHVTVPYLNLKAELHQHVVTNAIYFDENAQPQNYDEIYSNTTISLQNDIHYKMLHLENSVLVQLQNENIYGLPTLWSRHNLYMQFYMFKKNLYARWGIETRLSPRYSGLSYNPAVQAFHLSGNETAFYPMTDVYFSGKIKKFRLFIKLENATQLIDRSRVDFRVANRPQHDWSIRFGVAWLFLG